MAARLCVFAVCFFAVVVIAQSVDGKWAGEVQGGRGPQPVTLTLKADSGKLTGTVVGGRGGESADPGGHDFRNGARSSRPSRRAVAEPRSPSAGAVRSRATRSRCPACPKAGPGAGVRASSARSSVVEAGLYDPPCFPQNTYFAANCMMRGSRIVVTRPKAGLLSARRRVVRERGVERVEHLPARFDAVRPEREDARQRDVEIPRGEATHRQEVRVAVAAERRQRKRGAIEVLRVQVAGLILVDVVEHLVGRLVPQPRQRAIDAGGDRQRRRRTRRDRARRNASSTQWRSTRGRRTAAPWPPPPG